MQKMLSPLKISPYKFFYKFDQKKLSFKTRLIMFVVT